MFRETKKLADTFDGWLTEREEKFLFLEALRSNPRGVILEIGSWQGKSTTYLVNGVALGKNKNKIYAIDPHIGSIEHEAKLKNKSSLEKFKENMEKVGISGKIETIIDKSQSAAKDWKLPISLLWIDGDHSYVGAKADFDLYFPFLVKGGVVALHDSTQGSLPRVVYESFKKKGVHKIRLIDSIAYAKISKNENKDLRDYFVLYLIRLYPLFRKLKVFKLFKVVIKKIISKMENQ